MTWPRDDAKLDRVRTLMADRGLDALVVRAPDNVLYLTNFWGMKGYDACVFPREGDATLICLEATRRGCGTHGLDVRRPPLQGLRPRRSAATARPCARRSPRMRRPGTRRVGLELSLGTQASDRMVGEPTTYTRDWFEAFGERVDDATPLLVEARAVKTEQEIERMRLANAIAAAAMEHCRLVIEPGMTEAQIAAEWLGFVHGEGTGWEGKVDLALGFSLVWSGPGIKTFTATTSRPVVEGEPTLFEIWVCADGYWCDHTKNLVVGELTPRTASSKQGSWASTRTRVEFAQPGREPRRARPAHPRGNRRDRLSRANRPIRSATESAPGRTSRRTRTRPAAARSLEGMVLAIEPGCYMDGGGGLRVEDNFLITANGAEKLSPFPDGIVPAYE